MVEGRSILGLNGLQTKLAQRRQQAFGGLEICRVQTLRELLEHRPQKRPGSLASSLIRQ